MVKALALSPKVHGLLPDIAVWWSDTHMTMSEKQHESWSHTFPPMPPQAHGLFSSLEAMIKGVSHVTGESYLAHVKEPVHVTENNVMDS